MSNLAFSDTSLVAQLSAHYWQTDDVEAITEVLRVIGDRVDPKHASSGSADGCQHLCAALGAAQCPVVVVATMARHATTEDVQAQGLRSLIF